MGDTSDRATLAGWAGRAPRRDVEDPPPNRSFETSGRRAPSAPTGDGVDGLSRVVEAEIIPRLMLLARMGGEANSGVGDEVRPAEIDALLAYAVARDVPAAVALVEALRARGAADEAVCLALVAPAARDVGRLWEEDEIDFAQATMALFTLHAVVRHIGVAMGEAGAFPTAGRRVLLGMACGDQHTLGLAMVAEFLRRAGWDVWQESDAGAAALREIAASEWFDAIGLSAARVDNLAALAAEIRGLKAASLNPAVRMVLGGHVYHDHPDLAQRVGADAVAADAREAVLVLADFFEPAADQ